MKYFFFGEFGWYHLFIVPLLERLKHENEKDLCFELYTFPDYKEIIEIMFPSIKVKCIEFLSTNNRSQHYNNLIDKIFIDIGYNNLFIYLTKRFPLEQNESWPKLYYPLIINNSLTSLKKKIGIFPRYRKDHWQKL